MFSHLEEKIIDDYRSNKKNKNNTCNSDITYKSNNSDDGLQIKPAF